MKPIAITPLVEDALRAGLPILFSSSGGRDSQAAALATADYLKANGFTNQTAVATAFLGRIEWVQSKPKSQELAEHLGIDFLVTERAAGGMIERWQQRWESSIRRYQMLETVHLVSPWSTPKMRFCSSELKAQPLDRLARKFFKGKPYISVTGIRREESAARAKKPVSNPRGETQSIDWRPIMDYSIPDVHDAIAEAGLLPHEGYTKYGMTRISCTACIMSSIGDLKTASSVPEHAPIFRELIELEITSGFSFQNGRWLGEVARHVMDADQIERFEAAKLKAERRRNVEALLDKSLHFQKGWPTRIPTEEEAVMIAHVRREVSSMYGMQSRYLEPVSVMGRYAELVAEKKDAGDEVIPLSALPPASRQLGLVF